MSTLPLSWTYVHLTACLGPTLIAGESEDGRDLSGEGNRVCSLVSAATSSGWLRQGHHLGRPEELAWVEGCSTGLAASACMAAKLSSRNRPPSSKICRCRHLSDLIAAFLQTQLLAWDSQC